MDEVARQRALAELYAIPGHLLWRASALVGTQLDRILPPSTDIHAYAVLVALADHEPQSQSSLARLCAVSGTTMTSVAGALQREGLVERVRSAHDRRSYALTRTSAGRAAVRRWAPHVRRFEERISRSFSPEESARLRELLREVCGDQLDPQTPDQLLESLGFLVAKAHLRSHREFVAVLRPFEIDPRDYGTIRSLRVVGPSTQGQLAELLEVSPATCVQIVDHLERRGLLRRQRDEEDRRAYRLVLTPAATEVAEAATAAAHDMGVERFGSPRSRARADLVRLLARLLRDGHD